MNIFKQTKQYTSITRTLLFCIGILLSCSVFAAKPGKFVIGGTGPGGGIIFQLSDDGKHGLEAAPEDQDDGTGIKWYNGTDIDTHAVKTGINDGSFNTDQIIIN